MYGQRLIVGRVRYDALSLPVKVKHQTLSAIRRPQTHSVWSNRQGPKKFREPQGLPGLRRRRVAWRKPFHACRIGRSGRGGGVDGVKGDRRQESGERRKTKSQESATGCTSPHSCLLTPSP